jgi:hypothetical protein
MKRRFSRSSPGDHIPAIPSQRFKRSVDYRITDAWKLDGDLNVFGGQYLTHDDSNQNPKVPPCWVTNLHPTYQVIKNVEVSGLIQLLFSGPSSRRAASTATRSEPIIFSSSMTREPFFRECRLRPMRGWERHSRGVRLINRSFLASFWADAIFNGIYAKPGCGQFLVVCDLGSPRKAVNNAEMRILAGADLRNGHRKRRVTKARELMRYGLGAKNSPFRRSTVPSATSGGKMW